MSWLVVFVTTPDWRIECTQNPKHILDCSTLGSYFAVIFNSGLGKNHFYFLVQSHYSTCNLQPTIPHPPSERAIIRHRGAIQIEWPEAFKHIGPRVFWRTKFLKSTLSWCSYKEKKSFTVKQWTSFYSRGSSEKLQPVWKCSLIGRVLV